MQELGKVWECFPYLQKAKAKGQNGTSFDASFSQRDREEKNEDPQRAAMNQAAQKGPDVDSEDLGWKFSFLTYQPGDLG